MVSSRVPNTSGRVPRGQCRSNASDVEDDRPIHAATPVIPRKSCWIGGWDETDHGLEVGIGLVGLARGTAGPRAKIFKHQIYPRGRGGRSARSRARDAYANSIKEAAPTKRWRPRKGEGPSSAAIVVSCRASRPAMATETLQARANARAMDSPIIGELQAAGKTSLGAIAEEQTRQAF